MTRWLVSNCKTGAFMVFATEGMARRASVHKGWVDFTIERVE